MTSPCTIPWINIWRSLPFIVGALSSISILIGIEYALTIVGLLVCSLAFSLWTVFYLKREKKYAVDTNDGEHEIDLSTKV